jgi:hypothetical protein
MEQLTQDERENAVRQSEITHLTIGLHEARLAAGHPFAIETGPETLGTKRAEMGPLQMYESLRGKPRLPLDLRAGDPAESPVGRITKAITASMWDTYNQIYGLIDPVNCARYMDFLQDPDLSALVDASNAAGDRLMELSDRTFRVTRYLGAHTVHAGLEVGIGFMTTFAAIKDGLPPDHPFDPVALSRLIARTDSTTLTGAGMEFHLLPHLDPGTLTKILDTDSPIGVTQKKVQEYVSQADHGCVALHPMGPVARDLLQRHGLYRKDLDGPPAMKIVCERIRAYVKEQLAELRVTMDFHDSAKLPPLDRHIIDRTLLTAAPA